MFKNKKRIYNEYEEVFDGRNALRDLQIELLTDLQKIEKTIKNPQNAASLQKINLILKKDYK